MLGQKMCRENQNTNLRSVIPPPPLENRAVYEIKQYMDAQARWRMYIECRIQNATHTLVFTLSAFPLQQWLHERA